MVIAELKTANLAGLREKSYYPDFLQTHLIRINGVLLYLREPACRKFRILFFFQAVFTLHIISERPIIFVDNERDTII